MVHQKPEGGTSDPELLGWMDGPSWVAGGEIYRSHHAVRQGFCLRKARPRGATFAVFYALFMRERPPAQRPSGRRDRVNLTPAPGHRRPSGITDSTLDWHADPRAVFTHSTLYESSPRTKGPGHATFPPLGAQRLETRCSKHPIRASHAEFTSSSTSSASSSSPSCSSWCREAGPPRSSI